MSWSTQMRSPLHLHKQARVQQINTYNHTYSVHSRPCGIYDPKLTYSTHIHNISEHAHKPLTKYCAHLHHTLAALKWYFPDSLVAPLPNSEQINLSVSNHTYTKSTPNHIHHHYAPSVTIAPTYTLRCHPWMCGHTPLKALHCWPDGRRSWLVDHKREDRTPNTSKG